MGDKRSLSLKNLCDYDAMPLDELPRYVIGEIKTDDAKTQVLKPAMKASRSEPSLHMVSQSTFLNTALDDSA